MFGAYTSNQQIRLEYNGQNGLTDAFVAGLPAWFQIRKKGSDYTFYYRTTDDGAWVPMTNPDGSTYVYTKTDTPLTAGLEDKDWGGGGAHTDLWSHFIIQSAPTTPAVTLGDLNGDGKISVADATLSLRIAVGLLTATDDQKAADDVNKDGKWTVGDTTLILQVAVGVKSGF
jgi:hypothetical protein